MQQWKGALSDFSTLFGWDYKTNEWVPFLFYTL
jgi:hypothetical protein